jgi:hypothetical protein
MTALEDLESTPAACCSMPAVPESDGVEKPTFGRALCPSISLGQHSCPDLRRDAGILPRVGDKAKPG